MSAKRTELNPKKIERNGPKLLKVPKIRKETCLTMQSYVELGMLQPINYSGLRHA